MIFTLTLAAALLGFANEVLGASLSASLSSSASLAPQVGVLEFSNFGYSGTYNMVLELKDPTSSSCTCKVDSTPNAFSGINAPLNEEVSVHFRGPLTLSKFAVYTASDFVVGTNGSGSWNRLAYYDASSQTSDNVTFLTTAGDDSPCLGKALTFADSDGTSKASESTVLAKNAKLTSNQEFSIFSDIKCGSSGLGKDCGVYREGIPAFHGFYGAVKMFTFEFTMPTESSASSSISNYNMPAIWLLNAHIPRTAQYSDNVNCSCWRSGCGEFDIFEVKNGTTEPNHLYATIHDYQGTGEIETGLQVPGYIARDTSNTMRGGVVFDSNGDAVVWMSLSTAFDSSIAASNVNGWIGSSGSKQVNQLLSVKAKSSALSKKSGGAVVSANSLTHQIVVAVLGVVAWIL